ncbi:hypothetical protein [Bacillus sp. 1P06AnD]|uniref:hypothetical protein n=1 Tax=Bacillus sp. 1P06AnD TaxID=3132208 RepID=UPI0039A2BC1A
MTSLLPNPSGMYFTFVAIIVVIEIGICRYWCNCKTDGDKKYNDIIVFLMLSMTELMSAMPLFRLTFHSSLFIIGFVIYAGVLVFSFYKRRTLLHSFVSHQGSKLMLGLVLFISVLIVIGNLSFSHGQKQILALLMGEDTGLLWGCFY